MKFFNELWIYLTMMAPYFILGLVFAGFIQAFITKELITKLLGGASWKSVVNAALIGVPLPLCSCSVVPTAIAIKKKGASNGATSAFLISTPESGVDSMALTYGIMDLPMTIMRPVMALISGVVAGTLQNIFNNFQHHEQNDAKHDCCRDCETSESWSTEKITLWQKIKSGMAYAFGELLDDMSSWLVVGIILGSVINYFLPANFFSELTPSQSRLLIILVGVPFYVCASAATPIAAALVMKGLSPGVALLFLLVGPATHLGNLLIIQKYIGKKGVIINVFTIIVVALVGSYFIDFLYAYFTWEVAMNVSLQANHDDHDSLFNIFFAVLMVALLIKGLYFEHISSRISK